MLQNTWSKIRKDCYRSSGCRICRMVLWFFDIIKRYSNSPLILRFWLGNVDFLSVESLGGQKEEQAKLIRYCGIVLQVSVYRV